MVVGSTPHPRLVCWNGVGLGVAVMEKGATDGDEGAVVNVMDPNCDVRVVLTTQSDLDWQDSVEKMGTKKVRVGYH